MDDCLRFTVEKQCGESGARLGRVETPHGGYATPAFMPVGTKATVKGLLPEVVGETGSEILLNNTYHLMLRPGSELVQEMGGVHKFMNWDKPILTDSGGFQVFSLGDVNEITDDGVKFKSHYDGSWVELSPERSMQIQNELGADIMMAFDDCPPAPTPELEQSTPSTSEQSKSKAVGEGKPGVVEHGSFKRHMVPVDEYGVRNRAAAERTHAWLERCVKAHGRGDQALFGIIQGGTDLDLRSECVDEVCGHDLPGYAIGGCAVGEGHEAMMRVVNHTAELMPEDKPRYLMGVGYEKDLVAAVRAGVDMFDCVLPTRNGRNATAFTRNGRIRLKNAKFARAAGPIDENCDCRTCRGYSCAYLRHLFMADEMLGGILVSIHNIRHFQCLMVDIRDAIRNDNWTVLKAKWPVLEGEVDF